MKSICQKTEPLKQQGKTDQARSDHEMRDANKVKWDTASVIDVVMVAVPDLGGWDI